MIPGWVAERRQQALRGLDGEHAVRRSQGGTLLAEVALREWVGVACESQEQPEHGVGEVIGRADAWGPKMPADVRGR